MGKGQGCQKTKKRTQSELGGRDLEIEARFGRDITNLSRPHADSLSISTRFSESNPKLRSFKTKLQQTKQKVQFKAIAAKRKNTEKPFKVPAADPKETKIDKINSKKCQMVSAFHREILLYLKTKEPSIRPQLADTDSSSQQWNSSKKAKIRAEQVNWIIKTHIEFSLKTETCLLSLNLFDRCLDKLSNLEWMLLAVACMRISSKYEEILINELGDYEKATNHKFSRQQINNTELQVIEAVGFAISQTCHITVVERVRLLQGLDSSFMDVSMFLLKVTQIDSRLATENQYILSVAIAALVSERVFHKPVTDATLKALFVCPAHVMKFLNPLKQAIKASVMEPLNPARRCLIQYFGTGPVKKMEDLMLQ